MLCERGEEINFIFFGKGYRVTPEFVMNNAPLSCNIVYLTLYYTSSSSRDDGPIY